MYEHETAEVILCEAATINPPAIVSTSCLLEIDFKSIYFVRNITDFRKEIQLRHQSVLIYFEKRTTSVFPTTISRGQILTAVKFICAQLYV